jgi:hypothetical protein
MGREAHARSSRLDRPDTRVAVLRCPEMGSPVEVRRTDNGRPASPRDGGPGSRPWRSAKRPGSRSTSSCGPRPVADSNALTLQAVRPPEGVSLRLRDGAALAIVDWPSSPGEFLRTLAPQLAAAGWAAVATAEHELAATSPWDVPGRSGNESSRWSAVAPAWTRGLEDNRALAGLAVSSNDARSPSWAARRHPGCVRQRAGQRRGEHTRRRRA